MTSNFEFGYDWKNKLQYFNGEFLDLVINRCQSNIVFGEQSPEAGNSINKTMKMNKYFMRLFGH